MFCFEELQEYTTIDHFAQVGTPSIFGRSPTRCTCCWPTGPTCFNAGSIRTLLTVNSQAWAHRAAIASPDYTRVPGGLVESWTTIKHPFHIWLRFKALLCFPHFERTQDVFLQCLRTPAERSRGGLHKPPPSPDPLSWPTFCHPSWACGKPSMACLRSQASTV